MKKHPFLTVDFHSTVKLSDKDQKQLQKWLWLASESFEKLMQDKVLSGKFQGPMSFSVSLLICGEARIKKLNFDFRQKNKVTDVLSFPAHQNLRKAKTLEQNLFLGDLAICHQVTQRQAREFNISYFDEFIHLFFHGLLHLIGYDHELSAKEERLMQDWEDRVLKVFSDKKKRSR